ncbi:unnamed protein product [Prorocentrum cordatum]|uniref:Uncharacterized protein n=1 Tax=Prorocentrum cordatum TaxID=2364126 RepID=A0ABN9VF89_9DINO|nr:unnamed protein product [Polarella glacialis]
MDTLMTLPSPTPATKYRAVGSAGLDQVMRELTINTAKNVVAFDGANRRLQGALSQVALAGEQHPYLEPVKQGTKKYEAEKKVALSIEERALLVPASAAKLDKSAPDEKKKPVIAYHSSQSDINAILGHVITCHQKKAHRQKTWGDNDRYKIALLAIPKLSVASVEIFTVIALEPEAEVKKGAPPRNPNIRKVFAGLVGIGEYQEMAQTQEYHCVFRRRGLNDSGGPCLRGPDDHLRGLSANQHVPPTPPCSVCHSRSVSRARELRGI